MADQYKAKLNPQFNPQWAEYTLKDENKLSLLRQWQKRGHEVGLHHHGYDHGDWNGYTNKSVKEDDPKFSGSVEGMMRLLTQLVEPYEIFTGTITDEEFDYPIDIFGHLLFLTGLRQDNFIKNEMEFEGFSFREPLCENGRTKCTESYWFLLNNRKIPCLAYINGC